jgi:hypothetical protein
MNKPIKPPYKPISQVHWYLLHHLLFTKEDLQIVHLMNLQRNYSNNQQLKLEDV